MKKAIFGDLLDRLSTVNVKPSDSSQAKIQAKELLLTAKEEILKAREEVEAALKEIAALKEKELAVLEKAAGLSQAEAEKAVMKRLEEKLVREMALRIKEAEEKAEAEAETKAKEIIAQAVQRAATDYVAEYTTSTIKLQNDEIKGRIIGKEGRNIRAFEKTTGVDVELEEEGEITLSSFDPVRRVIAKKTMERLIADGRIQPVKIEKTFARTKNDFQQYAKKVGRELCLEVRISHLPEKIVEILGRYKYRTSYGQSLYQHTLEVFNLGRLLAAELGADIETVKLACLLHDIGKVLPSDIEGSHTKIGVEFLRRHGIAEPVLAAISAHHEETPIETLEQIVVYVADAISGARPGARYELLEDYLTRISELENIAKGYGGVADAYAIEAGREVRVVVKPKEIDDDQMKKLAFDIAAEIHEKTTTPGQVKVTVIRETRQEAIAGQEGGEEDDETTVI